MQEYSLVTGKAFCTNLAPAHATTVGTENQ